MKEIENTNPNSQNHLDHPDNSRVGRFINVGIFIGLILLAVFSMYIKFKGPDIDPLQLTDTATPFAATVTKALMSTSTPTMLVGTVHPSQDRTETRNAFPTIAFSNYKNLAPINQWSIQNINKITGIVLSPDKQKIALLTFRSPEQWWLELRDTESGDLLWDVNVGIATYNALAFSPDGSLLATGTGEGNVRIWDTNAGEIIQTFTGHTYAVRSVLFSHDGKMIASGASDNTARVWEVSSGSNLSLYRMKSDVRDIAWSPDNQYLAVTSNYINVYDVLSRNDDPIIFYDKEGDSKDLGEVSFSPNGLYLIGAGEWYNNQNNKWRYRVFIWDFPNNKTAPTKIPLDDAIDDTVISPDNQVLVGTYKDRGELLLIDILDREIKVNIDIGPTLYMTYSPDINTFAIVSTEKTVTIWGISP